MRRDHLRGNRDPCQIARPQVSALRHERKAGMRPFSGQGEPIVAEDQAIAVFRLREPEQASYRGQMAPRRPRFVGRD